MTYCLKLKKTKKAIQIYEILEKNQDLKKDITYYQIAIRLNFMLRKN